MKFISHILFIKPDNDDLHVKINGSNGPNIAVEDHFLIVVADLHHFIVFPKAPSRPGKLKPCRIEAVLQLHIEIVDADDPFPHGREHLYVSQGIQPILLWHSFLHQGKDLLQDEGGVGLLDENEVAFTTWGKVGHLPSVDGMRALNNVGAFFLTENGVEADGDNALRINQVFEYTSGTDTGKLVYIADQDKARRFRNRLEKGEHEVCIDHGHLVYNDQIGIERVFFIPFEPHRAEIHFEKAVDCACMAPANFTHSLCCPSGRGGQHDFFGQLFMDAHDGFCDRALSRARAPREDEKFFRQTEFDRFLLLGSKANVGFLFDPFDRLADMDCAQHAPVGEKGIEIFADGIFRIVEEKRGDPYAALAVLYEFFAVDSSRIT